MPLGVLMPAPAITTTFMGRSCLPRWRYSATSFTLLQWMSVLNNRAHTLTTQTNTSVACRYREDVPLGSYGQMCFRGWYVKYIFAT